MNKEKGHQIISHHKGEREVPIASRHECHNIRERVSLKVSETKERVNKKPRIGAEDVRYQAKNDSKRLCVVISLNGRGNCQYPEASEKGDGALTAVEWSLHI